MIDNSPQYTRPNQANYRSTQEFNQMPTRPYQIIELPADLNATASLQLDQYLEEMISNEACPSQLLINCQRLEHISAAGIGVFIAYLKELEIRKIKLVFYRLNTSIRELIKASRLARPLMAGLKMDQKARME